MQKIFYFFIISTFIYLYSALPASAKGIDSINFDGTNYSISGTTDVPDGARYCILEDYGSVYVIESCAVTSGSFVFVWPSSTYTPEANHQPGYGYLAVVCSTSDCSSGEVDFINGYDSQLFNTIPHGLTGISYDGINYSVSGITNIPDGSQYCLLEDFGNVYVLNSCEVSSGNFTFSWPASSYTPEANHQPGYGYLVVVCTTSTCSGNGNINDFIVNSNSHLFDSVFQSHNTPVGNNIIFNDNNLILNFSQVNISGNTTVTTSPTGSQPPTGFRLGNPPTYYNISTTAVFSGNVEVCIDYSSLQIQGNENNLKLMHYDAATGWTNITTSLDTTSNIICGITTSFSEFAVMTAPTIQDLISKVQEMNLQCGIENSLDAKLEAAQEALNANNNGNTSTAVNKLSAFINEVEAQRGNKLTYTQADELHHFADNLMKLIQNIVLF